MAELRGIVIGLCVDIVCFCVGECVCVYVCGCDELDILGYLQNRDLSKVRPSPTFDN